jgi:hypothetical protein
MLTTVTQQVNGAVCKCPRYLNDVCGVNLDAPPPGVHETLIYSKSDGIVAWESCIETGPLIEAIEVPSDRLWHPV